MSITDRRASDAHPAAHRPVELSWRYDDDTAPREITVFPADGGTEVLTQWLTVDVDTAVHLEEMR